MLPFSSLVPYTSLFLFSFTPNWGNPIIQLIRSDLLLLAFGSHLASTYAFLFSLALNQLG
jgi:hypothetical protein